MALIVIIRIIIIILLLRQLYHSGKKIHLFNNITFLKEKKLLLMPLYLCNVFCDLNRLNVILVHVGSFSNLFQVCEIVFGLMHVVH